MDHDRRAPRPKAPWRALGKTLVVTTLALLLVVTVLRTFFFGYYRVESLSMEPTLHGEPTVERVVVAYDSEWQPVRHDLVVLRDDENPDPIVKRVAGLPGETVLVRGGDVYIDGALRPASEARPEWIPIASSAGAAFGATWQKDDRVGNTRGDSWLEFPKSGAAGLHFRNRGTDDYRRADGSWSRGSNHVGDLVVRFRMSTFASVSFPPGEAATSLVVLRLTEAGDVFDAEIEWADVTASPATVRLVRGDGEGGRDVLVERATPVHAGALFEFSNIDNHLALTLPDSALVLLEADYDSNRPIEAPDPNLRHLHPRVAVLGRAIEFYVGELAVLRDRHYTAPDRARFGVHQPCRLGPDEVFVLGDNSDESLDSRFFGPVKLSDLIGRPRWVVWPAGSRRTLR